MSTPVSSPSVLIVGAGGFAGGFIVDEALRRGFRVWAGVRASTSRRYLTDPAIRFVELDFDKPDTLCGALTDAAPEEGKWDYIVYNLGATKCLHFADFDRINHQYLRSFTDALKEANLVPEKLLYMSSLSVMGPGDEKHYTPFTPAGVPNPDTRYGTSKLKAEMLLATSGIPYIIFRATGIYGPRERDYYLMLKSISRGFDFSVGFRRQMLTFIYVEDLARAIFDALDKAPAGKTYIISEDKAYTQKEFRRIAAEELGKKHVIPIVAPIWLLAIVSAVAGAVGRFSGRPSTLNRDKFHIMRQRNWTADISSARRDFGFNPSTPLADGLRKSIEWYRKNKWLK